MPKPPPQFNPDWHDFRPVLDAAKEGNKEAMNALFVRYYPVVSKLVHRSLATDLRAKRPWMSSLFSTGDVVQEVFHSVLGHVDRMESSTSEKAFVGYLAMLVKNRLIDSIRFYEAARRDGRRAARLGTGFAASFPGSGPPTQAASSEQILLFRETMASFPNRERLLLRERLEMGEQFQTLADQLGYPSADAARKAFYVAQAQLLMRLHKDGVDSPGGPQG